LSFHRHFAFAVLLVWAAVFATAQAPVPPAPDRWVTDTANFMSGEAAQSLNSRLEAYERSTGHQLIVYIATTTGNIPIEDWAVRAFGTWKVGRKGIDDGLVLFIMSADRRLRFEVGYGLEGQVPDAIASRIINEVIVPRVQAGDRDGAVNAGMEAVMGILGGQSLPPERTRRNARPLTLSELLVYAIIGFLILGFFVTHPSLAVFLLASFLSSGRGGGRGGYGGGGGGGGFSGGGGRSGGGGASGSW